MTWRHLAACRNVEPAVFFAEPYDGPDYYDLARAICEPCSVRRQCLESQLALSTTADPIGFFGGTTPKERAEIRKARRAKQVA